MPIRDCAVFAIDGTHASGKTTLIHALTAHYRRQGINVAAMSEPARSSPFMEEIVIHQRGSFDLAAEVDVFATHLQYQLRAARHQQLLIADKTIVNVLAYARMLLNIEPDTIEAAALGVDVFLLLVRDEHILLAERSNTGYAVGQWNLPSGKLNEGEDLEAALIRETREEIGLHLRRETVHMVTSVHYRNPEGHARVGFFFHAPTWDGEPYNAEPHKCARIGGSRWTSSPTTPSPTAAPVCSSIAAASPSASKAGHTPPRQLWPANADFRVADSPQPGRSGGSVLTW